MVEMVSISSALASLQRASMYVNQEKAPPWGEHNPLVQGLASPWHL